MKVVIAIDSLKGSLSSLEAGKAIKEGIEKAYENEELNVIVKPLADGGEGTVEALVNGMKGIPKEVLVSGPLLEKVVCPYGYLPNTNTAIIEMAGAAGINLISTENRNPMKTTTYGVGEVIKHAINEGTRNFIIGIGGSATNDCGLGMLQALGYKFLDKNNNPVGFGGHALNEIVIIDDSEVMKELEECSFKIACDVTNPLYGPNGASYVYGPQKGANPEMVEALDQATRSFSSVVTDFFKVDYTQSPGVGAAGGLGFAFLAFLKGELQSGIEIILEEIKLAEDLKDADYVVTGEGRLDFQTAMGKAPIGVAKLAKKHGAKVIAFAGAYTSDATKCNEAGIDAYFSISNGAMSLEEAMDKDNATKNIMETAEQVFRLIHAL